LAPLHQSPHHFVLAILLVDGRYVLQLRDDKPGISAPGVWALFGGRIEPGERPAAALTREIHEELCIQVGQPRHLGDGEYFNEFLNAVARYSLFEADVTAQWAHHRVMEGQAAAHFGFDQLAALPMPAIIRSLLEQHHSKKALNSKGAKP
jgi:8-oxo-dGTP pyrophosphatase MutT (NUDIX family)